MKIEIVFFKGYVQCTPNAQLSLDLERQHIYIKTRFESKAKCYIRRRSNGTHDISSSIYARCPVVPSFLSKTERTSREGFRPRDSARLQRFKRAIPMQG